MDEEKRKCIKDYLTICLMILYLFTSLVGIFLPKAKEFQPIIKDNIELLKE
jgi:hypothetical protein